MITINIDKAKAIAHDIRRHKRAQEFEPLDSLIAKQIPGTDAVAAEAQRQAIREKYNGVQNDIDQSQNVDELSTVVASLNTP